MTYFLLFLSSFIRVLPKKKKNLLRGRCYLAYSNLLIVRMYSTMCFKAVINKLDCEAITTMFPVFLESVIFCNPCGTCFAPCLVLTFAVYTLNRCVIAFVCFVCFRTFAASWTLFAVFSKMAIVIHSSYSTVSLGVAD